jgi:hypothetical protein
MSGVSEQEQASSKLYGDLNNLSNYKTPYSYADKINSLNKYYQSATNDLNTQANEDIALSNKNTAGRLASQGVTGGGLLNSAVASGANNITKNKFSALSQLKTAQAGQNASAMSESNQDSLNEYMAALKKYGAIQGSIAGLNDDTWLDDVLSGVSAVTSPLSSVLGTEAGSKWLMKLLGGG